MGKTYQEIADITSNLLENETEWEDRYGEYINSILKNRDYVKAICKCFQPRRPIVKYLTVGKVKDAINTVNIDLRISGHSIATVNVNNPNDKNKLHLYIKSEKKIKDAVQKCSNICFKDKELSSVNGIRKSLQSGKDEFDKACEMVRGKNELTWNSRETEYFRSTMHSKCSFGIAAEHTVETLLLNELGKSKGENKYLLGIQPCTICEEYYQLITPLAASKAKEDEIKYSGGFGGGIDILARIRIGSKSKLCVIELKDEYKSDELPTEAIKQAIAYSTFLIRLIRSQKARGEKWYKEMFKINKTPDKMPISVNAVIAMPFKDEESCEINDEDKALGGQIVTVTSRVDGEDVNDEIHLHYMFFKTQALLQKKRIKNGIITSLPVIHNNK